MSEADPFPDGPLDPLLFGDGQRCFGCGPRNDVGLRLRFAREGDEVVTRFVPREGHEGVPGVLHGGLSATVADELAVWTLVALAGRMAFTSSMQVRFLRPARMGIEVVGRGRIAARAEASATIAVQFDQAGEATLMGRIGLVLPDLAMAERMMGRAVPPEWHRFCRP